MEIIPLFLSMAFFFSAFFLVSGLHRRRKNSPRSPPSLPLIGHLHLLRKPLHQSLASLSSRCGPILSLRFGSRPVLLVSSPSAAESCFSINDAAFADRPRFLAGKHLGYNYSTLIWASYGPHWRSLRRIIALEILSPPRLRSISDLIFREISAMVEAVGARSGRVVEMRPRLFELNLNLMMKIVAGKGMHQAEEFRRIVREMFEVSGATNLGDFIPLLRFFDYKALEKRLIRLQGRRDRVMQELIDERRRWTESRRDLSSFSAGGGDGAGDGEEKWRKCLIDNLLSLQKDNPEQYTDETIKGIAAVLLSAGTDTSALTTEWALALLLRSPTALSKTRAELDRHVGNHRLINEADLPNLPYLRSVVKETLRLHPIAPIIPAHESNEDCTVEGFHVPKGVLLLVNAWAIQRDPSQWAEAEDFRPERWEGGEGEGEEGEAGMRRKEGRVTLFFGMGRRSCPGEAMALRVVALALGALVQCFDWKNDGVGGEVDLTEGGGGLSMPMAKPLKAFCEKREVLNQIGLAG